MSLSLHLITTISLLNMRRNKTIIASGANKTVSTSRPRPSSPWSNQDINKNIQRYISRIKPLNPSLFSWTRSSRACPIEGAL